jgi:hypothetical protein
MGKRGNSRHAGQRGKKAVPPAPVPERSSLTVRCFRGVLITFVLVAFLVGAGIYWPREAPTLVSGLGVDAQCSVTPEVKVNASVVDAKVYRIDLTFGNLRPLECTQIRITVPGTLIGVIQIHMSEISPEELKKARVPFTNFTLSKNIFGQAVLVISAAALNSEPLMIELNIRGLIQDSFEKFRLLIPAAITIHGDSNAFSKARLKLYSIVIPDEFDIVNINPSASSQQRQVRREFLNFDGKEFPEIDILLLDRTRDTWKSVFNVFAAAIWSVIQQPTR